MIYFIHWFSYILISCSVSWKLKKCLRKRCLNRKNLTLVSSWTLYLEWRTVKSSVTCVVIWELMKRCCYEGYVPSLLSKKLRFNLTSEGLARKRLWLANDSNLDQALYHWFVQARADGVPISGPVVCVKATNLDKTIQRQRFHIQSQQWMADVMEETPRNRV